MTCEVVIMNRQAVVMAADSATTVTQWIGGSSEERYFKGTHKIFQLSNYRPVGMMIYAAANLQGVPWDVVAKDFREQHLGQKSFNDLGGYAQELSAYILGHEQLFPDGVQEAWFLNCANRAALMHLYINVLNDEVVKGAETDNKRKEAIETILANDLAQIDAEALPAHFEQTDLENALTSYSGELAKTLGKQYASSEEVRRVDFSRLAELSIKLLLKRYTNYMDKTGIVLAGFGENDYFPAYREYDCFGLLLGKLLFHEKEQKHIERDTPSSIKPFATTAMVNTFVAGFSPDVLNLVESETRKSLREFAESLLKESKVAFGDGLNDLVDRFVERHTDAWTSSAYSNHAFPLFRVIGSLPVDEMAELAETLIMLESLKEKVTRPTESVGGPIDVCVISKSDGFVWIKRKHYFDPKLNPQYFLRQGAKFE